MLSFSPQNHFNVRASFLFYVLLIMAGWAGSTTVWVPYDRYIDGPTPDALSVRCSLFLSLFLSVSLPALSSPSTFSVSFSLYLHSIFCAPTLPPFSNSHHCCTAFLSCMSLSVLLSTKQNAPHGDRVQHNFHQRGCGGSLLQSR